MLRWKLSGGEKRGQGGSLQAGSDRKVQEGVSGWMPRPRKVISFRENTTLSVLETDHPNHPSESSHPLD